MIEFKEYPFSKPIIWYVCFHEGRSLWGRRFRHVSLAGYAEDTWLHFDLHRTGVSVAAIYRYEEASLFREYLLANFAVVKVGFTETPGFNFARPMTCVGFVKHVIGLRSSALRPDSLFRCLLRNKHGVWVNDPESQREPGADQTAQDC